MTKTATSPPPPRRDQALAFIIERIARSGGSPSFAETGRALAISTTRAKQLVAQLVDLGLIVKTPGAQRSLRVRDVAHSRALLEQSLRNLGWVAADPLGPLVHPFPEGQLPGSPTSAYDPARDGDRRRDDAAGG